MNNPIVQQNVNHYFPSYSVAVQPGNIEKKLPSMLIDESSVHKVDALCDYMGVTYSGIGPDFAQVLAKMRKDMQVYH